MILIQAQAIKKTINAESEVYKLFKNQVNLQTGDLNQYLFLDSLMDKKDAKVLVGLSNSIINLGNVNAPVPNPPQ